MMIIIINQAVQTEPVRPRPFKQKQKNKKNRANLAIITLTTHRLALGQCNTAPCAKAHRSVYLVVATLTSNGLTDTTEIVAYMQAYKYTFLYEARFVLSFLI